MDGPISYGPTVTISWIAMASFGTEVPADAPPKLPTVMEPSLLSNVGYATSMIACPTASAVTVTVEAPLAPTDAILAVRVGVGDSVGLALVLADAAGAVDSVIWGLLYERYTQFAAVAAVRGVVHID
jgi:hypothetical protein